MKFSLLLASRERIPLLCGLLDSLENTIKCQGDTEVLVVFDEDDYPSVMSIAHLRNYYCNLRCFTRERSPWMHRDYINWVFPHCTGKYIIVLNDDTKMINPGWDELAFNKLESYLSDKPDGVVCGQTDNVGYVSPPLTNEYGNVEHFSCFPLVSRQAIEAMGCVMPPERRTWGGDSDLHEIFTHSKVNRTLDLQEIKIQHISYHTGLRERDEVSYNIERNYHGSPGVPIYNYIDNVQSYINEQNNRKPML